MLQGKLVTARARLLPYGKSSDREWSAIEPYFVPLRAEHMEVMAYAGQSPEDEAAEREELEWRTVTPEDDPSSAYVPNAMVLTLLDDVLSIESAYILRRALGGESQRVIALACGITQQSVQERLAGGIERLRLAVRGEPLPRMKRPRMRLVLPVASVVRPVRAAARVFSLDEAREKAQIATARAKESWEVMLAAARDRTEKLREAMANVKVETTWTPNRAAKELQSLNPNRRKRARKVLRAAGGQAR